ncbi:MAG: calcium-binding protein [Pseudomonadota bacterium]
MGILLLLLLPLALLGGAFDSDDDDGAPDTIPDGPPTGTFGDDDVTLTDGDDIFDAFRGNDTVDAGAGFDDVDGGPGDDSLSGGLGKDLLFGDGGSDTLDGGGWNDVLVGGNGGDELSGGAGTDILFGEGGNDLIDAGAWSDLAIGGAGEDTMIGGVGGDFLTGGLVTSNTLSYDAAEAIIDADRTGSALPDDLGLDVVAYHDDERDVLDGGEGDDLLFLGQGDEGTGGSGADVFEVFYDFTLSSQDLAVITDFVPGVDSLEVSHIDPDDLPVLGIADAIDGSGAILTANGVGIALIEGVAAADVDVPDTTILVTLA